MCDRLKLHFIFPISQFFFYLIPINLIKIFQNFQIIDLLIIEKRRNAK